MFIVLEGPDGAGTTTQAKILEDRLEVEGYDVVFTKEPTDSQYGRKIREASVGEELALPPEEFHKLFAEDRAEHVGSLIMPALNDGKIVVCDRYIPSSFAYGESSGVEYDLIAEWNSAFPVPDLTIFTMPPLEVCQERLARRKETDALEGREYQKMVYEKYEEYMQEHPEVKTVDTQGRTEDSAARVWEFVSALLERGA